MKSSSVHPPPPPDIIFLSRGEYTSPYMMPQLRHHKIPVWSGVKRSEERSQALIKIAQLYARPFHPPPPLIEAVLQLLWTESAPMDQSLSDFRTALSTLHNRFWPQTLLATLCHVMSEVWYWIQELGRVFQHLVPPWDLVHIPRQSHGKQNEWGVC